MSSNVDLTGLARIDAEIREAERFLRTGGGREDLLTLYLHDWALEKQLYLRERGMDAGHYLRETFREHDRIAVVMIRGPHVIQRIDDVENFAKLTYQDWLRQMNSNGYGIYHSMASLKPDSLTRRVEDIAYSRHVYLDLDHGGRPAVDKILIREDIPRPNYVLNTSPDKYQVVWKAERFSRKEIGPLLRNLARDTGADMQATDMARCMRMPGFRNQKYPEIEYYVTVERTAPPDRRVTPADFPERLYAPEHERERERTPIPKDRRPVEIRHGLDNRVAPDVLLGRALEEVPRSGRNKTGFLLAAQLRDNGYSPFEAERVLRNYRAQVPETNMKGRKEPYTLGEMRASLLSAYRRQPREPWAQGREQERAR